MISDREFTELQAFMMAAKINTDLWVERVLRDGAGEVAEPNLDEIDKAIDRIMPVGETDAEVAGINALRARIREALISALVDTE